MKQLSGRVKPARAWGEVTGLFDSSPPHSVSAILATPEVIPSWCYAAAATVVVVDGDDDGDGEEQKCVSVMLMATAMALIGW